MRCFGRNTPANSIFSAALMSAARKGSVTLPEAKALRIRWIVSRSVSIKCSASILRACQNHVCFVITPRAAANICGRHRFTSYLTSAQSDFSSETGQRRF